MTTKDKDQALKQAMFPLAGNTNFQTYVNVYLRDLREYYLRQASMPANVASNRLTPYYLGKIEAITEQIDQFDDWKQAVEDNSVSAEA